MPSRSASPCSTALVTSSLMTSESGVASSAGRCPKAPVLLGLDLLPRGGDFHDQPELPVDQLVEVHVLAQPLRKRLVHRGDRGHPAHGLVQALPALLGLHPARLHAQQRGNGLQVVLHPVVDLADRRVLGDQLLLAAAQLAHVAAQHQRTVAALGIAQRDRAQRQGHPHRLDLGAPGHLARDHQRQRLVDQPAVLEQRHRHLGERPALQGLGSPEPAVGGDRVGAGVLHHAVGIQADEPVAHARGAAARAGGRGEVRPQPPGAHPQQVLGALPVGQFQPRGHARAGEVQVHGEHGQGAPVADHRHGLDEHRVLPAPSCAPRRNARCPGSARPARPAA